VRTLPPLKNSGGRFTWNVPEVGCSRGLVAVSIVTDPFADGEAGALHAAFPDRVLRFKEHFVTDLTRPLDTVISSAHRRSLRKASRILSVERATDPARCGEAWNGLYSHLIERHRIQGLRAFSKESFEAQLAVPGVHAFVARDRDSFVAMLLWMTSGSVAYYHLGASSPAGYAMRASFVLFEAALRYFAASGLQWASLGAGAGAQATESGLTRFKQGWSTETRPVYFCGRILDRALYEQLAREKPTHPADEYFPAYRAGELAR
jgi:hypothetical protein